MRGARRGRAGHTFSVEHSACVQDGEWHLSSPVYPYARHEHKALSRASGRLGPRIKYPESAELVHVLGRVVTSLVEYADGKVLVKL